METAPIALFVYKRPEHTRQTIAALRENLLAADSDLVVFSDAPRSEVDMSAVAEVRQLLASLDGFKSITVIERTQNLGLANSIIDGVNMLCSKYGRVIVVEDDLVTSPYFLTYMNDGLRCYENDDDVVIVQLCFRPNELPGLPPGVVWHGRSH